MKYNVVSLTLTPTHYSQNLHKLISQLKQLFGQVLGVAKNVDKTSQLYKNINCQSNLPKPTTYFNNDTHKMKSIVFFTHLFFESKLRCDKN